MKKIICLALCLLSVNALAQGVLSRVTDAEHMKTVFIEKGNRALGIAGSYWSFNAGGDVLGDGYAVMSLLNIGSGKYATYYVAPKFSYFIGNDLSLDARLEYRGYTLNTDLRLDLRNAVDLKEIAGDDPKLMEELNELLNLRISGRHMVRNAWAARWPCANISLSSAARPSPSSGKPACTATPAASIPARSMKRVN